MFSTQVSYALQWLRALDEGAFITAPGWTPKTLLVYGLSRHQMHKLADIVNAVSDVGQHKFTVVSTATSLVAIRKKGGRT